jgi:hypothetical protein
LFVGDKEHVAERKQKFEEQEFLGVNKTSVILKKSIFPFYHAIRNFHAADGEDAFRHGMQL